MPRAGGVLANAPVCPVGVFRQADAQKVTDFARQKKLGLLSFWNLQRDRPGSGSLDDFSLVNTRPYEFYQIMKVAKDSLPPAGALANGRYTIVSAHSGKCVDVAAASTADGANIQQYQCNGTGAQAFDVSNMGNDVYRILNANSGMAVDVASASLNDGANIQQWSSNNTGAQRFTIKASGTGFVVRNQTSGKCMDVAAWSNADGGNIQQWSCSGNLNQVFRFVK